MTTINIAITQDDLELRPQALQLTAQLLTELAKPLMGGPQAAPAPAAPVQPSETPAAPVQRQETPAPAAAPAAVPPAAPAVPTAAPQITYDQLVNCGRQLMTDPGKGPQVQALLTKYAVRSITDLPVAQYPAMAADLRALGGAI